VSYRARLRFSRISFTVARLSSTPLLTARRASAGRRPATPSSSKSIRQNRYAAAPPSRGERVGRSSADQAIVAVALVANTGFLWIARREPCLRAGTGICRLGVRVAPYVMNEKRSLELLPDACSRKGAPTSTAPSLFLRTPVHRHKQNVGESFIC
jgi:hypothetical protein